MPFRISLAIAFLLVASLVPGRGAADAQTEEPSLRPAMQRIFAALAELLPASLDERAFWDPAQRAELTLQLQVLAESSAELEAHASQRDPTFRHLSHSLHRDVAEIQRSYTNGRIEEARFYVLELTQNCIACHSRLPSVGDFSLAEELTGSVEVATLERREQMNLLFATRQFEAALSTWEAAFADPSVLPLDLDVSGELGDYLTLCLRVKQDPGRALRGLAKLQEREDLPRYLQGRIRAWSAALAELLGSGSLAFTPEGGPSLSRARTLIRRSGQGDDFPYARHQLIYDLVASGELYRLLDAHPQPEPDLAEAYFLLGAIETRSADSYWIPQAEFHLATAVRLEPDGPFAEPAYELLEEYAVANYGGTTQEWVPLDIKGQLVELQKLLQGDDAPPVAKPGSP